MLLMKLADNDTIEMTTVKGKRQSRLVVLTNPVSQQ